MAITWPTKVPDKIHIGDSLLFEISPPDYSASEWTGNMVLSSSTAKQSITATASGSAFQFNANPTTTATWAAGNYQWQIYFTQTGYRVTYATGRIVLLANISSAAADVRTFARKIADSLESAIQNRATNEQLTLISQSCGELNLAFKADVYLEWQKWDKYAKQQEDAGKIGAQMGKPRGVYARFL